MRRRSMSVYGAAERPAVSRCGPIGRLRVGLASPDGLPGVELGTCRPSSGGLISPKVPCVEPRSGRPPFAWGCFSEKVFGIGVSLEADIGGEESFHVGVIGVGCVEEQAAADTVEEVF